MSTNTKCARPSVLLSEERFETLWLLSYCSWTFWWNPSDLFVIERVNAYECNLHDTVAIASTFVYTRRWLITIISRIERNENIRQIKPSNLFLFRKQMMLSLGHVNRSTKKLFYTCSTGGEHFKANQAYGPSKQATVAFLMTNFRISLDKARNSYDLQRFIPHTTSYMTMQEIIGINEQHSVPLHTYCLKILIKIDSRTFGSSSLCFDDHLKCKQFFRMNITLFTSTFSWRHEVRLTHWSEYVPYF